MRNENKLETKSNGEKKLSLDDYLNVADINKRKSHNNMELMQIKSRPSKKNRKSKYFQKSYPKILEKNNTFQNTSDLKGVEINNSSFNMIKEEDLSENKKQPKNIINDTKSNNNENDLLNKGQKEFNIEKNNTNINTEIKTETNLIERPPQNNNDHGKIDKTFNGKNSEGRGKKKRKQLNKIHLKNCQTKDTLVNNQNYEQNINSEHKVLINNRLKENDLLFIHPDGSSDKSKTFKKLNLKEIFQSSDDDILKKPEHIGEIRIVENKLIEQKKINKYYHLKTNSLSEKESDIFISNNNNLNQERMISEINNISRKDSDSFLFSNSSEIKSSASNSKKHKILPNGERIVINKKKFIYPNNYAITTTTVFLKGENSANVRKKNNQIFIFYKRKFSFALSISENFSCFSISISTQKEEKTYNIKYLIKLLLKILIVSAIYFILWLYIIVFIQSIYTQYGNRTFDICMIPLLSMLLIDPFFTSNIWLFATTFVLYLRGKIFLIKKKKNILDKIIISFLVPQLALNHYQAIVNFRYINKLKRIRN